MGESENHSLFNYSAIDLESSLLKKRTMDLIQKPKMAAASEMTAVTEMAGATGMTAAKEINGPDSRGVPRKKRLRFARRRKGSAASRRNRFKVHSYIHVHIGVFFQVH